MIFKNTSTQQTLSAFDFLNYILEEAENNWIITHDNSDWTELTKTEQFDIYGNFFETQLKENWKIIQI